MCATLRLFSIRSPQPDIFSHRSNPAIQQCYGLGEVTPLERE